jgi:hypothetical protein
MHRGALAYECGTEQEHGHLQGIVEIEALSSAAVNSWIRRINKGADGLHVRCVALSHENMHTFVGMLGYIFRPNP